MLLAVALWLGAHSGAVAAIDGRVVGVVDGDTIDVLVDRQPIRIRLAEIDAPERRQPFGTQSRNALAKITFGREVHVVESSTDRYGRTVGTVFIGARNVNGEMVASGMAWAYRRYVLDVGYLQLELNAREQRVGLWRDPYPIAPWAWRRIGKGS